MPGRMPTLVIERELTDDSPEVVGDERRIVADAGNRCRCRDRARRRDGLLPPRAAGRRSAAAAAQRRGAHQGARHRRELRLFGTGLAHERRRSSTPSSIDNITAMAGLPAARDAIREGTPVAYWRAGITHTANPSGGLEPAAGDYSVRLDPKGELVAFATGYATDGNIDACRSRDRPRRSASRRSRKHSASTRPATSSKSSSAPFPPARPR